MFNIVSHFKPSGDQPEAIDALAKGFNEGRKYQTLLGVTGSGKTFTLANVLGRIGRPALVLSHNKTLAAQLYSEFKGFMPDNAVEYFVSYYDYYLPESYIPQTDTYIAKDASINENIERLRLSATSSLVERSDVLVVASVSCIYGLGSPQDYEEMCVKLSIGDKMERDELLRRLIVIQYERNDMAPEQGQFRVRGDSVEIHLPHREEVLRVEFWGDSVESLARFDLLGKPKERPSKALVFPARHFVMPQDRIESAIDSIKGEMKAQVRKFESEGKLVEAQRLYQRVNYDTEMLKEIGYCAGIENYSMHLSRRPPGSRPFCLMDFFPKNFVTIIDESHVTIPQLQAMFKADRSRKQTLVDHGFRLPSALDNRPLKFEEFLELAGDILFVSATPGDFELKLSGKPVEQVVRPTGLLDPKVIIRPLDGQVDDIMAEIREVAKRKERCIVTTLTKKSAERLSDYLNNLGLHVKYLHSEIDAIERVRILNELANGDFDCLIGINLLREGIDMPEVSLVAILDADKEGFLRSERSLVQVAGRAARNLNGRVILYADKMTGSIKRLLEITDARRKRQMEYNKIHGITPKGIVRMKRAGITEALGLAPTTSAHEEASPYGRKTAGGAKPLSLPVTAEEAEAVIEELEKEMLAAAEQLEFERAASLRDKIKTLRQPKV